MLAERMSAAMQPRAIRLRRDDGPMLNVTAVDAGKPTCVLIHGHADGAFVWDALTPSLVQSYSTVALDLRGHGDSEWDRFGRYDVQSHVADVMHVIEQCTTGSFILIGHSLGAHLATYLCAHYRKRVVGLVLVDFGPRLNPEGMIHASAMLKDSLRLYETVESYADWLKSTRPLTAAETLDRMARCALRRMEDGYRLKIDPMLAEDHDTVDAEKEQKLWGMFRGIICPTLIVRGNGSAVFSRTTALSMLGILARSELVTVRGAGHSVMLDNPRDFEAAVLAFLAKQVRRC